MSRRRRATHRMRAYDATLARVPTWRPHGAMHDVVGSAAAMADAAMADAAMADPAFKDGTMADAAMADAGVRPTAFKVG